MLVLAIHSTHRQLGGYMSENIQQIKLGIVNAYLVKVKDGFILIDSGIGSHWNKLESALMIAGCFPGKLNLVIVTHGDFDHSGNCAKLQKVYKAPIAIHKDDSSMVESGISSNRLVRSALMKFFVHIGNLMRKVNKKGFNFETFIPDLYLTDGMKLSDYGFNATVYHTPGHTKGSIVILTDEEILISGDTFSHMFKPDFSPFIDNLEEFKNSLNKINSMNFKVIYPGHGKPFLSLELDKSF